MKSIFTKIFLFCIYSIVSFSAYGHGTIIFPNVEHGDGFIDVKIYDSKESFLDEKLAIESVRKRVKKGEVVVPLSKIHEGNIPMIQCPRTSCGCGVCIPKARDAKVADFLFKKHVKNVKPAWYPELEEAK